MNTSLDSITRRQIRRLERELGQTFSRAQALEAGSSDPELRRLTRRGYLARLGHGLYSVIELPTRQSEAPLVAATAHLFDEPHFVSWRAALAHHGLTEQVPFVVTVAVRRPHRDRGVGGLRVKHVVLDPRKFYGFSPIEPAPGSARIAYPEKAILDSLDRPDLAGGLREVVKALGWTTAYDPALLVSIAKDYPVRATRRRLGYLLETLEIVDASGLVDSVWPSGPLTPLDPHRKPDETLLDRRWWVEDNVGRRILEGWSSDHRAGRRGRRGSSSRCAADDPQVIGCL